MALTAYFDESGHRKDPQTHVVSVGGFVTSDEIWDSFTEEWLAALLEFKLPYFHMADFANKAPRYRWPEKLRRERLNRLLRIIVKYPIASIAAAIPIDLYDSIVPSDVDRLTGGPYGLAALHCMLQLGTLAPENIALIFEDGAEGASQVANTYELFQRTEDLRSKVRLDSFLLADKRRYPPLQAADILAYEMMRNIQTKMKLDSRDFRPYPLAVLRTRPNIWHGFEAMAIKQFSDIVSSEAGEPRSVYD
ncbi:MAG: DUF3800 domain-containing protein [Chloroflexi bacterium]|nr:DUF3800 domain-containing protein [Chloroflexota bacterium]